MIVQEESDRLALDRCQGHVALPYIYCLLSARIPRQQGVPDVSRRIRDKGSRLAAGNPNQQVAVPIMPVLNLALVGCGTLQQIHRAIGKGANAVFGSLGREVPHCIVRAVMAVVPHYSSQPIVDAGDRLLISDPQIDAIAELIVTTSDLTGLRVLRGRQPATHVVLVLDGLFALRAPLVDGTDKPVGPISILELQEDGIILGDMRDRTQQSVGAVLPHRANAVGQRADDLPLAGLVFVNDGPGGRFDPRQPAEKIEGIADINLGTVPIFAAKMGLSPSRLRKASLLRSLSRSAG